MALAAPVNPDDLRRPGSADLSILIVDDHRSFADLLSAALNSVPGMRCVGTASTAAEGITLAAQLRPDIAVMDIQMPRQDGLAASRRIREASPDTIIAVVTAHRDPEWVSKAAQAGASAFIPKDGSLDEMIGVLRRVRQGHMLVAPSAFGHSRPTQQPAPAQHTNLTQRELQVLQLLGRGTTATQASQILGITLNTCRGYIKSLHLKLGVSSQLEAVVKAQQIGLIGPAEEH